MHSNTKYAKKHSKKQKWFCTHSLVAGFIYVDCFPALSNNAEEHWAVVGNGDEKPFGREGDLISRM